MADNAFFIAHEVLRHDLWVIMVSRNTEARKWESLKLGLKPLKKTIAEYKIGGEQLFFPNAKH